MFEINERTDKFIISAIYFAAFFVLLFILYVNIFNEVRIKSEINEDNLTEKNIILPSEKTLLRIKMKISSPQKDDLDSIKIFAQKIKSENFNKEIAYIEKGLYENNEENEKIKFQCETKEKDDENEVECNLSTKKDINLSNKEFYIIIIENDTNIENHKIRIYNYYLNTDVLSLLENFKKLIWNKK